MPTVRTVDVTPEPRLVQTERAIFGEAMACGGTTFEKQPTEDLDYVIEWGRWLASDTLTAATPVADAGITVGVGPKAPSFTPTSSKLWLSGGEEGVTYKITTTITTTNGRTAVVCFKVRVKSCDGC